jgi:hypothetical protein
MERERGYAISYEEKRRTALTLTMTISWLSNE